MEDHTRTWREEKDELNGRIEKLNNGKINGK